MSDRGLKILKPGNIDMESTDPNDYIFWTRFPPLTFLEKKTFDITTTNSCSLSDPVIHNEPHDYDFFPFVLGTVKKKSGSPTPDVNNRYFMPASDFTGINCEDDYIPYVTFNYRVKSDNVEIRYNVKCIEPMAGYHCPITTQVFTIELYFYMWELGSSWPI